MKRLSTVLSLAMAVTILTPAVTHYQDALAQEGAAANVEQPREIQLTILGMSCPFCAYGVQQKLKKLDGVAELEVVLETGIATLKLEDDADLSNDLLKKTVIEAGFEVAKIARTFESEFPDVNPAETD